MDQQTVIKTSTEELLENIGVSGTVTVTQEGEDYHLVIESEDNALLIGKHGNTLTSLEHVIALMIAKQTGEFKRIIIEIGDYRREREEYLVNLAARLKEEVIKTGYEKKVSGLKPWERRLVHMHLAEDGEVVTESVGEDRERILVIKKK